MVDTLLALSLHCLQDTFSSSHTDRAASNGANKPGAIRNISLYAFQNKHDHSVQDYKTGSTKSILGKSAILASTELMLMCIKSVSDSSYLLSDWDAFKDQWLSFNPY